MPQFNKKQKADLNKNRFPNFFLLFFILFFISLLFQNLSNKEKGNVSFGYQIEHLVNLDLLDPSENKKLVLSDQLSTFSGLFRTKKTSIGEEKYRYLHNLHNYHILKTKEQENLRQLELKKEEVEKTGKWFLAISGIPIPDHGYSVVNWDYDAPNQINYVTVKEPIKEEVFSLIDVENELKSLQSENLNSYDEKRWIVLGENIQKIAQYFFSPLLKVVKEHKTIREELQNTISVLQSKKEKHLQIERDAKDDSQEKGSLSATQSYISSTLQPAYQEAIQTIRNIIEELSREELGIRLRQLRSIHRYQENLRIHQELENQIEKSAELLQKHYEENPFQAWFFHDKEVSSIDLQQQSSDLFNRWYSEANFEWESFQYNAGTSFSVPNQPITLVLEKKFQTEEEAPNYWSYLLSPLSILLFILFLYFFFSKQMKNLGGGPMGFGRSPAKMVSKEENKVRFHDIAGIDESKEELQEVVSFLKDPKRFTSLGARIPKGLLCIGPPGTGKTLLAKAVAGEAHCPFFSISGSDFVEMFVGVGASRVRNLFDQAKKNAPCIIFIDEIDAVGRHRGSGMGGGHDEREQTLNQLLVEMDGFESKSGIILMAATNRPDVLDKALLRPGRFDRRIIIDYPDVKGRYEILKVHAKKVKLRKNVDLMKIAQGSPGTSGADLENILNESALLAAKLGQKDISQEVLKESSDKVRFGKERKSLEVTKEEKRATAYHEAGHAIIGLVVKNTDPVEKITIVPRGRSLGATHFLPEGNRLSYRKKQAVDEIIICVGGRCAEEIFLGEDEISSGAKNDILQATQLARSMVCEWGMSKQIGMIDLSNTEEEQRTHKYSEESAREIDHEVSTLIQNAYKKAKEILHKHKEQLEVMVQALLEFETLDQEDAKKIIENQWDSEEKKNALMIDKKHLQKDRKDLFGNGESEIREEKTRKKTGKKRKEKLAFT